MPSDTQANITVNGSFRGQSSVWKDLLSSAPNLRAADRLPLDSAYSAISSLRAVLYEHLRGVLIFYKGIVFCQSIYTVLISYSRFGLLSNCGNSLPEI